MEQTYDQLLSAIYYLINTRNLKTAYAVLKDQYPKKRSFASLDNEQLKVIIVKLKVAYNVP